MMRRWLVILGSALILLLPTGVAYSAKPETTRVDLSVISEDESQFASQACAFPIEAVVRGHVITTIFSEGPNPHVAINRFNIRISYTNPETGETFRITDAGPDIEGDDTVAIIGRSITGSGVIGRVVFDLETGEILFEAGRRLTAGGGAYITAVCEALAS
jgi:hypothetical protein